MLLAIAETLPDGVVVHDPSGGIRYANAAFLSLLATDGSVIGCPIVDLIHPDDRATVRERIQATQSTGQPNPPRLFRFLRRDGTSVTSECRGVTLRIDGEDLILVVARDLTERQRAAAALEKSEALLRTLIDELRIGVLVQGPAAEILVSNRAALELLGLERDQLLGKTSFDPDWNVVHEDGSPFPGPEHPVPTAIRTRRAIRDVVMGVYRPKRRDRVWLLVDAEPHLDETGEVLQVVCTFSDITEQRRVQTQAAAGDRLASMGRLAAGVAHEINNPLAYVIGHLELLRRASLGPPLEASVEQALAGAERVRAIVEDLRPLSRGDDEKRGPVDLLEVVRSASNIAAAPVRHRARIVTDLVPIPMVEGNSARLGQLVLNLLMNAAEAFPEGQSEQNEIRVRVRPKDRAHVILEVSDTGPGIAPDVIERIFDPFFTTKPMGAGTGLGLAICHGIATSIGGSIDVESPPGRGATFRVTLNVSTPPEAPGVEAPRATAPPSRVLLIDDEVRLGRVMAQLLAPKHDVHVETRAARALERLLAGEDFDVVFCDLTMPDMSGMDFHEMLERRLPLLTRRTVFMTGGAFTPRALAFLERHADRVLTKPFTPQDMERAIARVRAHATSD